MTMALQKFVYAVLVVLGAALNVSGGEPLCKRFSRYLVDRANEPISPCRLFFFAERNPHSPRELYFRVIIKRGQPITMAHGETVSDGDLKPYFYRWVILDSKGAVERAWLAEFIKNRDGLRHTIVKLTDEDWRRSRLEIYFEDVDGDGEREDVTYELNVPNFLR